MVDVDKNIDINDVSIMFVILAWLMSIKFNILLQVTMRNMVFCTLCLEFSSGDSKLPCGFAQ